MTKNAGSRLFAVLTRLRTPKYTPSANPKIMPIPEALDFNHSPDMVAVNHRYRRGAVERSSDMPIVKGESKQITPLSLANFFGGKVGQRKLHLGRDDILP